MASKKNSIRDDLNKASNNHRPEEVHFRVYKDFTEMLWKGALSIDELEDNVFFCDELARNFLLDDKKHIQVMQDEMRNMTPDRLFFIKAIFKQFGRGGSKFGPSYTGISAVAELCGEVKLPRLHVSLTEKLGFRYSASDEDLELLRKLYLQRQQILKEIYDECERNSSETRRVYTHGFLREEPKDFSERSWVMSKRWCYENKEYDFPSIKPMKARKFYDQARECASSPEPF